jgi:SAM-dependent methyltransferase
MQRLRELVKLFINLYYKIYSFALRVMGIIDFPVPPNSNMRRTSAKTIKHYIYSSTTTGLPISVGAQMHGVSFNEGCRVLDFGCGCASQLRYFLKNHPKADYYGNDIDPSTVQWVAENYPKVNTGVNKPEGPLSHESDFFDLAYTVSTFSHFNKPDVDHWLAELSRVLKPNGILIATIEGSGAIDLVAKESQADMSQIKADLDKMGIHFKNYEWLNEGQQRSGALTKSVDIASYFGSEYGHTLMTIDYFSRQAKSFGLELLSSAERVICDRQDMVIFRKV